MIELPENAFLISQILVGIAIIFDFVSFQMKDRKKILIFLTVSSILVAIHYFLLGKDTAFYLVLLWVCSFIFSIFSHDKRLLFIFLFLYIFTFFIAYKELYDIIIFISLSLILISKFQKNDKYLRIIMMVWTSCVILYNFVIFSPIWVVLEVTFLCSNLIWYYKHYIRKR